MSEIININGVGSPAAIPHLSPGAPALRGGAEVDPLPPADSVEISRMGRVMSHILQDSSLRLARINALRTQIAEGTFETPERINGTADRLLDLIG